MDQAVEIRNEIKENTKTLMIFMKDLSMQQTKAHEAAAEKKQIDWKTWKERKVIY